MSASTWPRVRPSPNFIQTDLRRTQIVPRTPHSDRPLQLRAVTKDPSLQYVVVSNMILSNLIPLVDQHSFQDHLTAQTVIFEHCEIPHCTGLLKDFHVL